MVATNVPRKQLEGGSLLQVEIPNIELERYSVMFSSLLHPGQQPVPSRQPSPNRQPSLLARRQANLQELSTIPPSDMERPRMHAELSSSHRPSTPTKSSSFSLFPPSPTASGRKTPKPAHEKSPLHRSATTPAAVSPSKAKFDFFHTTEQQDQVFLIVHTPSEPSESRRHSRNEDLYPQNLTPSEDKSTTTARRSPSLNSSRPTINSRNNNSNPQRSPDDAAQSSPSADPLRKAAEISIARQISMSRQQRHMMTPVVPKVAPQPLQPKIIDVHHGSSTARKSHHLVLEDAY